MFKIINTSAHPVVTTYMDVLAKAFKRFDKDTSNIDHTNGINKKDLKSISKKDCLVVDSPLVAMRYELKGFKNFCVWYQGVMPEESFLSHRSKLRFFLLSLIEKRYLKKAKMLFMVSDAMLDHYQKKYKLNLADKTFIMPCFNETGLNEKAFTNDKYAKNKFLYVGGMSNWQCFDKIASLYALIEKNSPIKTELYVYSFDKDVAEKILKDAKVKNYTLDAVDKELLSSRIQDMKYGFVLRENSIINNVATPTKFSNYISNGIIPIYSSSLKAFSKVDETAKIGIVCEIDNLEEGAKTIIDHMSVKMDKEDMKEKCQALFDDYYNAELYTEKISQKITDIMGDKGV